MVRCTKCDAELDVDEDEIEEGEIFSCPECDAELEVVQVHPVRLNLISEDEDDTDEDLEDDDEADELGDEDEEAEDEDEEEEARHALCS